MIEENRDKYTWGGGCIMAQGRCGRVWSVGLLSWPKHNRYDRCQRRLQCMEGFGLDRWSISSSWAYRTLKSVGKASSENVAEDWRGYIPSSVHVHMLSLEGFCCRRLLTIPSKNVNNCDRSWQLWTSVSWGFLVPLASIFDLSHVW
jgi:hypothetical protein